MVLVSGETVIRGYKAAEQDKNETCKKKPSQVKVNIQEDLTTTVFHD